jgi:hypothetical protein
MVSGQVVRRDKKGSWCGVMPLTITPPRPWYEAALRPGPVGKSVGCGGLWHRSRRPMAASARKGVQTDDGGSIYPKLRGHPYRVLRRRALSRYIMAQSNGSEAFTSP